jgi:hypothetical protein
MLYFISVKYLFIFNDFKRKDIKRTYFYIKINKISYSKNLIFIKSKPILDMRGDKR